MTQTQDIENVIPPFLRDSEKYFVVGIGLQGSYIYANKLFLERFESGTENYKVKTYAQTIHPDDLQNCMDTVQQCMEKPDKCFKVSLRKPGQNGEYYWTEWEFSLMCDGLKQPLGVLCVGLDVTQSKKTESALREHERKQLDIVNNLSEVYCTLDLHLNLTFVSAAIEGVLGYSAAEALLLPPEKRFPPESLDHMKAILMEELALDNQQGDGKKRLSEIETKAYHADGSLRDIKMRVSFIRDEHGRPTGIQCVIQDITDEKIHQNKIQLITERYREIAINSGTVVWEIDPSGRYTYVNEVIETKFGHNIADTIGKKYFFDFSPEKDREAYKSQFSELLDKQASWESVLKVTKDVHGNARTMLTSGSPHFGAQGQFLGYRGISIDITEQKRAEDALRQSEQELRTLLEEKEKVMKAHSLLANIACGYINIPISKVPDRVRQSLSEIGEFTGADRVFVFRYDWETMLGYNTYEWCREGITSWQERLQEVPMQAFERWVAAHKKGEPIKVSKIDDLNPDKAERQMLEKQGVNSLYSHPLMHDHHCLGCVGVETSRSDVHFDQYAKLLVRVFAELLVNLQLRARTDDELMRTRIMLEQAGQMAKVGAFEIDFKTGLRYWSKVCFDIHELEVGPAPNAEQSIAFYKDEPTRDEVREIIKQAKTDPNYKMDYTLPIITAKGKERYLRIMARTEFEGDTCVYIFGTAQDVTEELLHQEEQKKLLQLTQDQNKRLRNFAHIVAHNLKSHSGNFESLLELISKTRPDLASIEMMQLLKRVSGNLRETLDHLSQVALLRANEQDVLEYIPLAPVMERAILNVTASTKPCKVHNRLIGSECVRGIPAYLDSIFFNLLGNAMKYAKPDTMCEIHISATEKLNNLVVSITDNGVGIDLARHGDKLFGLYKTFHNHPEARGLGLFITKNQVEAIGGRIEVESEVGVGTTFHITLTK